MALRIEAYGLMGGMHTAALAGIDRSIISSRRLSNSSPCTNGKREAIQHHVLLPWRSIRPMATNPEQARLVEHNAGQVDWKRWGPYVSERAWGTVREDYSANGDSWNFFPHDHARSRAYRWNEDGIGGFCDDKQHICLAVALWNEKDPILKERMFGLSNPQGNHGEDVKEYYFFLDGTPTHSYMKMLYKYPQVEYPYDDLVESQWPAQPVGARVRTVRRAARHVSGQSLLRRRDRVRQGRQRRPAVPYHGDQSRPRRRADSRAAASLVSQHLVVGRRRSRAP